MRRTPLFLLSLGIATPPVLADPGAAQPKAVQETKDRLPPEKIAELVDGPMRAAEAGDLRRAERAFEGLVESARRRHGNASVREADLLTSFAVELYNRGSELERDDMRRLAPTYMTRAVAAAKRAFGPRHAETALALHSYADLLFELSRDDPPEEAEAALAEAYSIRRDVLGAGNSETLAAMRSLARIKAARATTSGKLDETADLIRRAIEISVRANPPEDHLKPANLRLVLVRAYVNAGRVDDALREARIAAAEAARADSAAAAAGLPCSFAEVEAMEIADILEADRPAEAETLRKLFPQVSECLKAFVDGLEEAAEKNVAR